MTVLSSFTAPTGHACASVYARWADPSTWPEWDPDVRSVDFQAPAAVGSKGKLRPRRGPALSFSITQMCPDRVFTNTGALLGARLGFEHVVDPGPDGSTVTVTVRLSGPLAPIWKRVMGVGLSGAARSSVEGLLTHLDAGRR